MRKVSGSYASGLSVPFSVDGDGGLSLSEGDAYIRAQVIACVSPNESDNPFQDLGGTERPVFENQDDLSWRRDTRRRIQRQFKLLEQQNLARLDSVDFQGGTSSGDYNVVIKYINLESTTSAEVTASLTFAGNKEGIRDQIP